MTKEEQDSISLCEEEEEGYKEMEERIKRGKMERVINNSETTKREVNNRNNENEPRNPPPFFSRGYSDRFISHQG